MSKKSKVKIDVNAEEFANSLKAEIIKEIRKMPAEDFLREVDFATFFNDKVAMEKFAEDHKKEIQLTLEKIQLNPVLKREREKAIAKIFSKKKKS